MAKTYRRITSAADLKVLHLEAKLLNKLEVGVSKGNILYAWDDDKDNLRSITIDEAAIRLGLTAKQVELIITSGGEVEFEEPKPIWTAKQELIIEDYLLDNTPAKEPIDEPIVEEKPVSIEKEAALVANQIEQERIQTLVEDIVEGLLDDLVADLVEEKLADAELHRKETTKVIIEKIIETFKYILEKVV